MLYALSKESIILLGCICWVDRSDKGLTALTPQMAADRIGLNLENSW